MSFILKALQKLEEENAARAAGPAAIESAILAPPAPTKAAPRRMLTWLVIVLVFLAGGAVTYLFIPKTKGSVARRQETVAVTKCAPARSSAASRRTQGARNGGRPLPRFARTSIAGPSTKHRRARWPRACSDSSHGGASVSLSRKTTMSPREPAIPVFRAGPDPFRSSCRRHRTGIVAACRRTMSAVSSEEPSSTTITSQQPDG